jgi:tetratricopeptide (TPR) repeat protein
LEEKMSLDLSLVVSNEKHYGPFVCGLCGGLASLDMVVTPWNNVFCRDCLTAYIQKCIQENSKLICPSSRENLQAPDIDGAKTMLVDNFPIRAEALKIAQPLAFKILTSVQVKCLINGSYWVGDYGELNQHSNGQSSNKSLRHPKPSTGLTRNTSVTGRRTSAFEDEVSRAGATTRGEPTAAHHLRSLPQHAEPDQVNLPELERCMERCDKLKKQANAKFNRGDIEGARLLYSEGLALISDFPVENEVRLMIASLYSNRAVTYYRERILPPSIDDCDKSLELDPKCEKTYIRKWRALAAMGEMDQANACLKKGLKMLPDSTKLQDELRRSMAPPASPAPSRMTDIHGNDGTFSLASISKMSAAGHDFDVLPGDPSPAALERSERLKKQANAKFNKGEIEAARSLYSDSLSCIPKGRKYNQEIKALLSILYSNRAVTYFRDKMYRESLADCEKAIELDPTTEKCYIRKSRALIGLEQLEKAYRCLTDGSTKIPNSKKIAEELRKADFEKFSTSQSSVGKKGNSKNTYDGAASVASLECYSSVGSLDFQYIAPISSIADKDDYTEELELADKLKRNANAKFNRGDIAGARLLYTEALGCLPNLSKGYEHDEVRACLVALYANRAVTFFREKDYLSSTSDCDKAIQLDPASEKTYIRKARALAALLRRSDAVNCLKEGLKALPNSKRLKEELSNAKEQLEGGRLQASNERDFQLSQPDNLDYGSVSSLQGSMTYLGGQTPKDAKSTLGSVAEGSELGIPFDESEELERAEKLKKQANAKLNKGDVAGARLLYGEGLGCLPIKPKTADARELVASLYANRAVTFFREKKFAATVIDCDKSLELDSKHEKSYIRKWRALMALGNFDDAFRCLEDAVKAIPYSDRLHEELEAASKQKDILSTINDLIANGKHQRAREILQPLVKTSDNVSLWLAAARADTYLGLTESALERVNKVLMFNPKHLEGLQVRGYALFLSGEMETGVTILKDALEVDIENVYQDASSLLQSCQKTFSGFSKGQARVKRGRYKEAILLFSGAMEDSQTIPVDSPLYSFLVTERAEASLLAHNYEDALEDCIEAIGLKKDNMAAWTIKVEVYFALERFQEARDELAKVRKSWGSGNDAIEHAYKKADFELHLQKADEDLRRIATSVETGIIPDIPDGEPLHFNLDDEFSKAPGKASKTRSASKSLRKSEKKDKDRKSKHRLGSGGDGRRTSSRSSSGHGRSSTRKRESRQ